MALVGPATILVPLRNASRPLAWSVALVLVGFFLIYGDASRDYPGYLDNYSCARHESCTDDDLGRLEPGFRRTHLDPGFFSTQCGLMGAALAWLLRIYIDWPLMFWMVWHLRPPAERGSSGAYCWRPL